MANAYPHIEAYHEGVPMADLTMQQAQPAHRLLTPGLRLSLSADLRAAVAMNERGS